METKIAQWPTGRSTAEFAISPLSTRRNFSLRLSLGDAFIGEIPKLRAFAISLSRDRTHADDLVQETLVKAWDKFDSFKVGTNLSA